MKKILTRLAVLVVLATAVSAGDCLSGSACTNQCPLAKQANGRFSDGSEGLVTPGLVRAEIVRRVLLNLEAL